VDALGLSGVVVVEQKLGLLGDHPLSLFVIAILRPERRADHLLGRDAVDLFGIDAHEVLAAAGDNTGLVAIGPKILQYLLHRLAGELGIRAFPARILGRPRTALMRYNNHTPSWPMT
jgi:hypothetical protein